MAERSIKNVIVDHGRVGTIVKGMRREQYDSINGMNFSSLKVSMIGGEDIDPTLAKQEYEKKRIPPSRDLQDSYDRGTLMHLILLQPEEIAGRVAEWTGKTRHGKAWDEFQVEHRGKLIMRTEDIRDVQDRCRMFRNDQRVRDLLRPCDTEVAVFSQEGKIYTKALIDAITREGDGLRVMMDPKSIRKGGINERSVDWAIRDCWYKEQMGWYWRCLRKSGIEVDKVKLLFVSLPPQDPGVYIKTLTTAALQLGEARVVAAFERLEECIDRDLWPMFVGDGICDVSSWEVDDLDIEGI